jgi:hypothetical protein
VMYRVPFHPIEEGPGIERIDPEGQA